MKYFYFILPFTILLTFGQLYSQNDPHFTHLTSDEGLTSSFINCIYKDKQGFLWIGTDAGLNRFDGTNIVKYSHIIDDSTSLVNNYVLSIFEDSLNRIWVGTQEGLSVLEIKTQKFINIKMVSSSGQRIDLSKGVKSINQFKNKIWIATAETLISTPLNLFHFETSINYSDSTNKLKSFFIWNQSIILNSEIWVMTSKGPIYSKDGITFYNKKNNPAHSPIYRNGWISAIVQGEDSIVYYGTFRFAGIYMYHPKTQQIDSIPFNDGMEQDFMGIVSLCFTNKDEIWGISYNQGIFRLNTKTSEVKFFQSHDSDPRSLSSNSGQQILGDSQGTIFVATARGLDYFNPLQPQFNIFNTKELSLDNMKVTSIVEDSNGILWLATKDKGLFSLEPLTEVLTQFEFPGDYNIVWSVYYQNKELLLATKGGLATFSTISKKIKPYNKDSRSFVQELLEKESVFIYKDKNESIWLGLYHVGILKYNPQNGEYIKYTSGDQVNHLPIYSDISSASFDSSEVIWVGYESNYFSAINTSDNSIRNFQINCNEIKEKPGFIKSIRQDNKGNLWIGTNGTGLFKYSIADNSYTMFDTQKKLSSNIISNIVIDHQNNLWISTSNGINKFDPITESFTLYNKSDGLPSNQFYYSANFISHDGTIFTGNDINLVSFNPEDIKPNPNLPLLVLPSYSKAGAHFTINSSDEDLNFNYKDKIITFDFLGINFIDPAKTQYAYLLDGYDDDWNYSGSRPSATYTGLPHGDYTLRIKATNKPEDWYVPEKTMKIHVTGPYWMTWWFIALCLSICSLIIYSFYRYRWAQFQKLQAIRNKISKDLHDDIGSTLSSISINSSVAENMYQDSSSDLVPVLQSIGESARAAMENMSDIVWAINPANETFQNMINRLEIFGRKILAPKNIHLHLDVNNSIGDMRLTLPQRKNIYLILKESINNIAKYSYATNCFIIARMENKKISLQIKDDGIGLGDKTITTEGNGLINMQARAKDLNAVLTILSEKSRGTIITLQFNP